MTNKYIPEDQIVLIYALIDPRNDRVRYIGWTSTTLEKRLYKHLLPSELKKKTHKNNWLNQLVCENLRPIIVEIEKVPYKDYQESERKWIAYYGRENLTNGTDGGEGMLGWVPSEDTRRKLSETMKKKMESLELRENLRKKAIEQWGSEEDRLEMANTLSKSWSNDMKEKARIRGVERWKSEEFRSNIIEKLKGKFEGDKNPMFGRKRTEEEKQKISKSRIEKGIVLNEETKEKISQSNIGRKKNWSLSEYVGVSKNRDDWDAKIRHERKTIHIGVFPTEIMAAMAYNLKSIELYGENAKINVLDVSDEEYNLLKQQTMLRIIELEEKRDSKTSNYNGVFKKGGKWASSINFNGKRIWLGTFPTEIEAALAVNEALLEYYGWKAQPKLNQIPQSEIDALWEGCNKEGCIA